ncbi:DUF4192 domain-containing protein [Arthrobacter sp.]|uniref:DUF4192 domain-containing protein n=1 Tax=Arthrobacter sp. TaxID=1667 RepID=UPI0026DFBBF9|nr:DUF4192 domain-containing protein [Arthrobacter sp.]MDO5753985.1 DUF4192 domain-containing protein [Arthrobacter sp.]
MGKQPEKISVSAGEDLLAFIPHIVGYWPENSIVCIGMQGKRLRATMRLDLPPLNTEDPDYFAQIAAGQLASDADADGCLLAIFGEHDWVQANELPHSETYRGFREAFAAVGIPVKDAWYVGPEYWRSLECVDGRCCPWPGKGIASIKESFVNAEFIFRGSIVRDNPKAQIQQLTGLRDAEFAASVTAAGTALKEALAVHGDGQRQIGISLGTWENALQDWPKTPSPVLTSYLLASLADATVRDAVIVALATSPQWSLAGAAGLGLLTPEAAQSVAGGVVLPCGDCKHAAEDEPKKEEIVLDEVLKSMSRAELMRATHDFGRVLVGEIETTGIEATGTVGDIGALESLVGGAELAGPDWVRLDRAEPLLQFLAGSTDSADKAPVLCLLGWIQWCKGRGTWAGHYFQACLRHHPGYRLAVLLDELLTVGHIAECAKNPVTAWHGYCADEAA